MTDPIMKGKFAVYETPDGGFHLSYVKDGEDETKHLEIPAPLVKMATMASEGKLNPIQAMRGLMGGKNAVS